MLECNTQTTDHDMEKYVTAAIGKIACIKSNQQPVVHSDNRHC